MQKYNFNANIIVISNYLIIIFLYFGFIKEKFFKILYILYSSTIMSSKLPNYQNLQLSKFRCFESSKRVVLRNQN